MTDRDIALRGSGELMHLIKEKHMSIEDILMFCSLIWRVDSEACSEVETIPPDILEKLKSLLLLKVVDEKTVMLNPHVVGIGDAKKRGELRVKFRNLK